MALNALTKITVTNAGLTQSFTTPQDIVSVTLDSNLTLASNVSISHATIPVAGTSVFYYINGTPNVDLNGNTFSIEGVEIEESQLRSGAVLHIISTGLDWGPPIIYVSLDGSASDTNLIDGKFLADNTVPLSKLPNGTLAAIPIVGGVDLYPAYHVISGDIGIDSTGVAAIAPGVIVNADINASAAIARTKIANGTASHVVINSGAGALSSEAQLANSRGGTGQDTSSSTGFAKVSAGTWSVGSIDIDRDLPVSFEAGETGDFKIKMGFDGTLTDIYAFATKVIAGTDNGTITPKNNAGTTMTSGTITFTAGDPRGTAYTSTPSANNTFVTGDILTFTTAKTTSGGKVHLSLKFTRNS